MSGIITIINKRSSNANPEFIHTGLDAIAHRGNGTRDVYICNNVSLGINHSNTVSGNTWFNNSTLPIVFDGEIYNYKSLREDLERSGQTFQGDSKTELLSYLYLKYGPDFLSKLDGMFALILLNQKAQKLIIAGDRFGMRQLCTYENDDYFIAASESKAILATGLSSRELNRQAFYDFFIFNYIPGNDTIFKSITRQLPATVIIKSTDSTESISRLYWEPTYPTSDLKLSDLNKNNSSEYYQIFESSLKQSLQNLNSYATLLSGGLDSTGLVATLKHITTSPISTFSIKLSGAECDESKYINETSRILNLSNEQLEVDSVSAEEFSKSLYNLELPDLSCSDVPMQLLAKKIKALGHATVLSGEGPDELLGGYAPFALSQLRRAINLPIFAKFKKTLWSVLMRNLISFPEERTYLTKTMCANFDKVVDRFGVFPPWITSWLFNEEMRNGLFLDEDQYTHYFAEGGHLHKATAPLLSKYKSVDPFNKALYLELKSRLPNYVLLRSDRNPMSSGIEARLPFLSNALVDFSNQLSPHTKLRLLTEKYIEREAFKKIVPKHILNRRKFGYQTPSSFMWSSKDTLIEEALSESTLKKYKLFNPKSVKSLLEQNNNGTPWQRTNVATALNGILSIQLIYMNYTPQP